MDREGEHHTDGDEVIFGFFGAGYELGIEIRWDVLVEDFAFTHLLLFLFIGTIILYQMIIN